MKKQNNDSGIIITVAGAVLVLVLLALFFAFKSEPKADSSLLIRDDSYRSTSDIKNVTMVEFADYQCPACGVAAPNIRKIVEEYRDKVTYIYRHFPLPQHTNALVAAEAAEAAGVQGKYWGMHELLYLKQNEWSDSADATSIFVDYAKDLGLNVDQFKADVASQKYQSKIERDVVDGNSLGVNSTPTIYLNGVKYNGSFGYDSLKSAVDSAISKAK